jgi:hypothetical protein
MVVFRYTSMSVPSSLSSMDTSGVGAISRGPFPRWCAPDEALAAVACGGIRWGTSMALMQLQRNTSRRALLRILYKKINSNIINSMIPYDGLGKYKPCLPRQKHRACCGTRQSSTDNSMHQWPRLQTVQVTSPV